MHAHSYIPRAVAAMDSRLGRVRPHQHGIAVKQKRGLKAASRLISLFKLIIDKKELNG